LVQRVLAARGLHDPDEIARFLDPKLTHLHDPALLPGIDVAATRIIDAVRRDQQIVIYGDYDVDGITATAVLFHTLKTIAPDARIRTYVPHRLDEGYGLNSDALRQLKADGADLVITVDCGISAIGPAQVAKEIGLELIITDHHETGAGTSRNQGVEGLPHAVAIVHPRLDNGAYPFGELCGAGVAFKLAWRIATMWCNSQRVSEALQKTLMNMLPLVALGTIADVVPLIDENRVMASIGLRLIKQSPLTGLRALIEASGLMDEKIDCQKVGFVLGPRLNACGRMGHAAEAMHMLTDASADEALAIARRLTAANEERQGVERRIFDHACRLAEDSGMTGDDHRIIVLAHESWHPGVVGIVCSRLVEKYGRPTVLMQRGRDLCKGSARSIDGYSIHEALQSAAHLMTTCGGHAMAAGLSFTSDHLGEVTRILSEHAHANIKTEQMTPGITIDCDASLHELDLTTVRQLQAIAPFGRSNRPPTLRLSQAILADPPTQMGANGRHLSLRLRQSVNGRWHTMRTVWWGAGSLGADLAVGMCVDAVVEPRINNWNNRETVEAEVKDVLVRERAAVAVS
jgi:single-stranded-DNA-specific exonuclease